MAFVSDRYRLIFVHTPKTGGTSVSQHLARVHGVDLYQARGQYRHQGVGGGVPREYRPAGIDVHDNLDDMARKIDVSGYTTFCVVRNPWARIFSFWQHMVRRGDPALPPGKCAFADVFRRSNCLLLQPQNWWCQGVDRVLRYENLAEEYGALCAEYGLPGRLPHLNRATAPADYRQHYDAYSKRIVEEFYRYEIERFGFQF